MSGIVVFRKRDAENVVRAVRDAKRTDYKLDKPSKKFHSREIMVGTAAATISASGGSGSVTAFDENLTARSGDRATVTAYNPYGADVDPGAIVTVVRDRWGIWWICSADCPA